jgi:hypothetical protein
VSPLADTPALSRRDGAPAWASIVANGKVATTTKINEKGFSQPLFSALRSNYELS